MSLPGKKITIAVDGYSACGKSSFARAIASMMNYIYVDSGAMYRAVTLAFMEHGLISDSTLDESDRLTGLLRNIEIVFLRTPGSVNTETILNGVNVEEKIRSVGVASNVSLVSKSREVREKMVAVQRDMGKKKGVVMDGRDIGTVVFPDAEIKIFMTADPLIRAGRRYKELIEQGREVDFDEIAANINERDRIDETREESPLARAPDAVLLDNSFMTPDEQMIWFKNLLSGLNLSHY